MKLSVLIPVYNELDQLPQLVANLLALPEEFELVFVDDASSDGSLEFLEGLSNPRVRLLRSPLNQGKGAAVRRALGVAGGRFVAIQDADLEYDPSDLVRLLDLLERSDGRVAYGYRNLSGQKLLLRFGNRLLTTIANLLFRSNLKDLETCYKVLDRSLALELDLSANRFDIEVELTAKLLLRGETIHQLPISYHPRSRGKKLSPWRDGPHGLWSLLRHRWRG